MQYWSRGRTVAAWCHYLFCDVVYCLNLIWLRLNGQSSVGSCVFVGKKTISMTRDLHENLRLCVVYHFHYANEL